MKFSLCTAVIFAIAFALHPLVSSGQQIDLVDAKADQDSRLAALQLQVSSAKEPAVAADLQKQIDSIRSEDLWSKTDGPPALVLQPGDTFHPFNFALLSDLHLSERNGPQRFQHALDLISKRSDIAFVLITGDIVWDHDPEKLKAILATAKVPVQLVYGNNDWKWLANGTYEKAFGPRNYTFTFNNCTFIAMYDCLPKGHFPEDHKGDFSPAQWTWLDQQLQDAKNAHAAHIFTAMHIPPDTPGAFDPWFFMYTNTETRFFDLLEKYDVSCALFGHLHQSAAWKHDNIQCYVEPSCCWNFIAKGKKVDSSFCRIVKVEQNQISAALLPVRLDGESFTYETLNAKFEADAKPH